jgi:hypothetical protein
LRRERRKGGQTERRGQKEDGAIREVRAAGTHQPGGIADRGITMLRQSADPDAVSAIEELVRDARILL